MNHSILNTGIYFPIFLLEDIENQNKRRLILFAEGIIRYKQDLLLLSIQQESFIPIDAQRYIVKFSGKRKQIRL
jgi:hypothetical protein